MTGGGQGCGERGRTAVREGVGSGLCMEGGRGREQEKW